MLYLKKTAKYLLFVFVFFLLLFAVWLSFSRVILTSGSVYHQLQLPIFDNRYVNLNIMLSAFGDNVELRDPSFYGPVVKKQNNQFLVKWFCRNRTLSKLTSSPLIEMECEGRDYHVSIRDKLSTYPTYYPQVPERVAIISDLHGNFDYFMEWAYEHSIIDKYGQWSWGNGHLVILGDSVNKGRNIYKLLWKIYELEKQAENAGGRVHFLLGNHEQYILKGNFSRAESEYLYATEQLEPFENVFNGTVIGEWLKSKPVMLQLGEVLFVHGGVSDWILEQDLSLQQLNRINTQYLKGEKTKQESEAIHSSHGITKFRGYVYETKDYALVSQETIDKTLDKFNVSYIVVGHTGVKELQASYNGAVYVVENTSTTSDTLFFVEGIPTIISGNLLKKPFEYNDFIVRDFDVSKNADWMVLAKLIASIVSLSLSFGK